MPELPEIYAETYPIINEKYVLILPCFWKLDFGVLPVGGVNDGRAADLGDSFAVAVKAPATNFVRSDHILDKLQ